MADSLPAHFGLLILMPEPVQIAGVGRKSFWS